MSSLPVIGLSGLLEPVGLKLSHQPLSLNLHHLNGLEKKITHNLDVLALFGLFLDQEKLKLVFRSHGPDSECSILQLKLLSRSRLCNKTRDHRLDGNG
jgi:hypothetical protein